MLFALLQVLDDVSGLCEHNMTEMFAVFVLFTGRPSLLE
jgi:hypothetical protein